MPKDVAAQAPTSTAVLLSDVERPSAGVNHMVGLVRGAERIADKPSAAIAMTANVPRGARLLNFRVINRH
jgi:hypothetical protein